VATESADGALEGRTITKYFGGLAAVFRVDFEVRPGEIFGLIGPNGAGKTTLFRVISGVYPPNEGRVYFKGQDITGLKPHQICHKGITSTHQIVRPFAEMTVLDNVLVGVYFGRGGAGKRAHQARAEAMALMEFTGLAPKAHHLARNLTLAERKRLEVARALATKPEVLLLDEVVAGLNPTETVRMMALVQELRQQGITIFMVEHVMKAVMGICDRIMVLHHGEKIAEGTPQEIARNPQVIEAYLGKTFNVQR